MKMAVDFSPNDPFFCECTVRIGQNIQNEVSVERSIFADADLVAYQFIGFNLKLNWSRKENMYRSISNENDQSRRQLNPHLLP